MRAPRRSVGDPRGAVGRPGEGTARPAGSGGRRGGAPSRAPGPSLPSAPAATLRATPLAAALLLAGLLAAPGAAGGQEPEGSVPEAAAGAGDAPAIMAELRGMTADPLWPGFRPGEIPVAIFDGERTWLFHHPDPPEGFAPAPGVEDARVAPGRHEAIRANTASEIGGVLAAVVSLDLLGDYATARSRAGVIVHEAFHVHQRRAHPGWGADPTALLSYPVTDADALFLRRLESRALGRAVEAEAREEAAGWAARALELRRERYGAIPAPAAEAERGTELQEGTAQFVQYLATGSAGGLPPLPDTGFAPEAVRWRAYVTGRSLALLLDRFAPGWKAELEEGRHASLDGPLAEALRGVEAARFPEEERARERERARRDAAAVVARRDSLRRAHSGAEGWRVVVADPTSPLEISFDPMNVEKLAEGELLHTRWMRVRGEGGYAEVTEGGALTVDAGREDLFLGGVSRLSVTGLEEEPRIEREDGTVSVTAPGFEARFDGAGVTVSGREVTVRVGGGAGG